MGIYEYSFEALRPRLLPSNRIERLRQFTLDAYAVLDTLLKYAPPQIPLLAPLPDKTITLAFNEPLPTSVLEQLVVRGYVCRDLQAEEVERAA